MIKLLIADDEKMTREGIRRSVDWQAFGVSEVREAPDGLEALSLLESYHPDIVLTDIKMPRMDGVELAFQVRRKLPNCKIIFMSGYAEKEYLKAAISLKALSYVEKPIDMDELEEALQQAVQLCLAEQQSQEQDALARESLHASSPYVRQEASLLLIRGNADEELLRRRLQLSGITLPERPVCAVVMVKLLPGPGSTAALELESRAEQAAARLGLTCLGGQKDELHTVVHLFSETAAGLDEITLHDLCRSLADSLTTQPRRFSVTAGGIVQGLQRLPESYAEAVAQLQETFYRGHTSVAVHRQGRVGTLSAEPYHPDPQLPRVLHEQLTNGSFDELRELLSRMAHEIRLRPGTLINSVKELYYRMLLELDQFARERGLILLQSSDDNNLPWELVFHCHFYDDIHQLLLHKLDLLEAALRERGSGSTASRIIRFIHQHYADEDVTVQQISEHMHMTASHLISVFKEATGTTVKQYLMEYRIERAKELLRSDRLKIFDVALQVGYKDGEYFSKIFRKLTGMTPSEFRERSR